MSDEGTKKAHLKNTRWDTVETIRLKPGQEFTVRHLPGGTLIIEIREKIKR